MKQQQLPQLMSAIKIILDSRSGKGGAYTRVENAMKQKRRFYLLLLSINCKFCWTATVVWYQRGVSKMGCWNGSDAHCEPAVGMLPHPRQHLR